MHCTSRDNVLFILWNSTNLHTQQRSICIKCEYHSPLAQLLYFPPRSVVEVYNQLYKLVQLAHQLCINPCSETLINSLQGAWAIFLQFQIKTHFRHASHIYYKTTLSCSISQMYRKSPVILASNKIMHHLCFKKCDEDYYHLSDCQCL